MHHDSRGKWLGDYSRNSQVMIGELMGCRDILFIRYFPKDINYIWG